jgi:hypothetical protein
VHVCNRHEDIPTQDILLYLRISSLSLVLINSLFLSLSFLGPAGHEHSSDQVDALVKRFKCMEEDENGQQMVNYEKFVHSLMLLQ